MKGVNPYQQQLSAPDIVAGKHREIVGGLWDEISQLQLDFLVGAGLLPEHRLLDVGCGCLRGGVRFVRYLHEGNFYGLDINASLVEAGKLELELAGLSHKRAHLLVDNAFRVSGFECQFDYVFAHSVFTHLFLNHITRCICEVSKVLLPAGKFYATFFAAPHPVHLDPIAHIPGNIVTNFDVDPFHYSFEELRWVAAQVDLNARLIGEWGHPREQQMICFTKR